MDKKEYLFLEKKIRNEAKNLEDKRKMPIFASSESTLLGMIFYFSGTGNTRWVASEIAKAINEELFYIPDLIREERSEFTLHDGTTEDEHQGSLLLGTDNLR